MKFDPFHRAICHTQTLTSACVCDKNSFLKYKYKSKISILSFLAIFHISSLASDIPLLLPPLRQNAQIYRRADKFPPISHVSFRTCTQHTHAQLFIEKQRKVNIFLCCINPLTENTHAHTLCEEVDGGSREKKVSKQK
jgi:hypothetical protein